MMKLILKFLAKSVGLKGLSYEKTKNLLIEMIRTDFKLRYQESVLGYLWSVLRPLFMFGILYTVFTKFLRFGDAVPNYALSLLLGIVLWNFFTEATSSSLKSVVGKGSLMKKIDIPRVLIPVPSIASALINLSINLVVIAIFLIVAGTTALTPASIIAFPFLIFELTLAASALGYFLATIYVKYRDIGYVWDVIKQALWYGIPLIYPLTLIPSELARKIIIINPIAQIIQDARAYVTYEGTPQVNDVYNSWLIHLIPILAVIIAFVFAIKFYIKRAPKFAEYI